MKLFIAYGDDRDYDAGSEWVIGVFSTPELAQKACDKDAARYEAEVRKYADGSAWADEYIKSSMECYSNSVGDPVELDEYLMEETP